jgi:hypothetical protein
VSLPEGSWRCDRGSAVKPQASHTLSCKLVARVRNVTSTSKEADCEDTLSSRGTSWANFLFSHIPLPGILQALAIQTLPLFSVLLLPQWLVSKAPQVAE